MNFKAEIEEKIKKALLELEIEVSIVQLEHPKESLYGDYSSNVAMVIFSRTKNKEQRTEFKTPIQLAESIREKLETGNRKPDILDKVEVVKPGFINFWLSKEALLEGMSKSILPFKGITLKGRKVIIEYTDPNPFKEFHIGHLFSNTVGESLSRLFEVQGAKVKRANYQGDVGIHVAKAIWGLRKKLEQENLSLEDLGKRSLSQRARFLGQAYAIGSQIFEKSSTAAGQIKELNKTIYEQSNEKVNKMYQTGRRWSLEAFEEIYKRLGTKFDFYYFESVSAQEGIKIVKDHPDIFKKDQGAIIFEGKKYGLHNRVFINSLGLPTYETKDLGLAEIKYDDFTYDKSYIVTGNEVDEYFKVILKALSLVNPNLAQKTIHISHGMVRLPGGKMSSRTGKVKTGDWLLDEAKSRLKKEFKMPSGTLDQVAVGAIKYALLKCEIGKNVIFDFDKSLSFDGDSGPYLQYTYARTQSVVIKSKVKSQNAELQFKVQNYETNDEELAILRHLYLFPEVVEDAAKNYAPNLVCTYLHELAQKYNVFYNKHRIIEDRTNSKQQSEFRLVLTQATGNILKTGLWLLGIQAPERM